MDKIFIQTYIIGQEKIFLLIQNQRLQWIQPLSTRLRIREIKSPTWASTTSILHLSIESLQEKEKLRKNTKVLQGQRDVDSSTSFSNNGLQFLCSQFSHMPSMYHRVPYIAFQRGKVEPERSQGTGKARSQVSRIHVKENSKRIWILYTS